MRKREVSVGDFQACFAYSKVVGNEEVLMVDMLPLNPLGRWVGGH